jgi:uncharacterized protein
MSIQPFHIALPVTCIKKTYDFYVYHLTSAIIKKEDKFLAVNFYGHYLAFRESNYEFGFLPEAPFEFGNVVTSVPSFHMGLYLLKQNWLELKKIFLNIHATFIIEPFIFDQNSPNEVGFMMVRDFNGYALEFKYEILGEGQFAVPKVHNKA